MNRAVPRFRERRRILHRGEGGTAEENLRKTERLRRRVQSFEAALLVLRGNRALARFSGRRSRRTWLGLLLLLSSGLGFGSFFGRSGRRRSRRSGCRRSSGRLGARRLFWRV